MNLVCLFIYFFFFLRFMQKFKMAAKVAGQRFLRKVASRLCRYPAGQKFHQNRSISLCCILRRWPLKVAGKLFLRKVTSRLFKYPLGQKFGQNHSISFRFREKRVFAFKAEIQDGRQKWREKDFWEKSQVDSAKTLQVKNFVEIALSCSVSEINAFYVEIQDGRQTWRKTIFWENCQKTLQIPCGLKISSKIALSCSVSEINSFLRLMQKFKMAAKSGGKMIFAEGRQ